MWVEGMWHNTETKRMFLTCFSEPFGDPGKQDRLTAGLACQNSHLIPSSEILRCILKTETS